MLSYLLAAGVVASWGYLLAAWWATCRLLRSRARENTDFLPPVSVLKPVKGLDPEAFENYASFCRQQYPQFELIFGVACESDGCVPVIQRLQEAFPQAPIRWVVCPDAVGNPKSCLLAELTRQARYEHLVISDSDIRVAPDYLRQIVGPLRDPRTGVVTCAYRTVSRRGWAGWLESLYLNTFLIPSIALANRAFGLRYGLGATLAMRRGDLLECGGYGGIARYLADDFQIARRIESLGRRTVVTGYLVEHVVGEHGLRDQWQREVRWAAGYWASQPLGYCCLPVTMTLPLAGLFVVVAPWRIVACALTISVALRGAMAWHIERRMGLRSSLGRMACLPARDALTALAWMAGWTTSRVTWRGQTFRVLPGGEVTKELAPAPSWAARAVRRLDSLLRRWKGVFEFSDDPRCLLRVEVATNRQAVALSDGTTISPGVAIVELHYWNERVAELPHDRGSIAWVKAYCRGLEFSFGELAHHLAIDARFAEVRAIHAEIHFSSTANAEKILRLAAYANFDVFELPKPASWLGRWRCFWRDFYVRLLLGAFSPSAAQGITRIAHRSVWISREAFVARFSADEEPERMDGSTRHRARQVRRKSSPAGETATNAGVIRRDGTTLIRPGTPHLATSHEPLATRPHAQR